MAAPPIMDIINQLPRNATNQAKNLATRALNRISYIGVHWNGPPVAADEMAQLVGDARYHIQKDWNPPHHVFGWAIMYHYAVGRSGKIYKLNPETHITWHINNGNARTLAILCILGQGQQPTSAQISSLRKLLNWLTTERPDFPAARPNVWGHGECGAIYGGGPAWGNATECPGPDLLAFVRKYRAGAPLQEAPPQVAPLEEAPALEMDAEAEPEAESAPVPETTPNYVPTDSPYPYSIGGAIADYWLARGGVSTFGWPISEARQAEMLDDGQTYTVQEFEGAWLHWRPGDEVAVAKLGVMYKQLKEQLADGT